jgi:hypothetical protein
MLGPREAVPTHRRGEALAAAAVLVVLMHAIFAQLTGVIAIGCHLTGRATRWRPGWLAAPAAVGLVWTLVVGTGHAVAGLLAGPDHILSCLTTSSASPRPPLRLPDVFAGATRWLPSQLPLALVTGSAEAALLALPRGTRRPGVVAAARRAINLRLLRAGELRARGGVAVGVDPSTGAPAAVAWSELAAGVLVTGAQDSEPALRLVHAALRRRQPVIVLDHSPGAGGLDAWLWAECVRYGCPVATGDLLGAVRGRAVALIEAGQNPERACRLIIELCAELRRIGADGDGLVWLRGREGLPGSLIAELAAAGSRAGLPLLLSTSDPPAELAGVLVISHDEPGGLLLGSRRVMTA